MSKARRGELITPLPVGLAYDAAGHVILDPDTAVRGAVAHLFATFAATGSATACVKAFSTAGLSFPWRHRAGPRKGELDWKPLYYISSVTSSIKAVLEPAGIENSKGLITAVAAKVPSDPRWGEAADVNEFLAFMKEWMPGEDPNDGSISTGYMSAWMTVKVLSECGDNLTRENLMKVVTSQKKVAVPLLLPGVTVTITPDNYTGYGELQMVRFDGKTWEPFGPVVSAE